MPRISAGLLMYRIKDGKLQVLLAHPGGPFFKNKDDDVWSIPKGEVDLDEDFLECAKREFEEETAVSPAGPFIALKPITQKGGKIVLAWAFEGDCDPSVNVSNTFTMEWPPRSGQSHLISRRTRAGFVPRYRWRGRPGNVFLGDYLSSKCPTTRWTLPSVVTWPTSEGRAACEFGWRPL